MDHSPSIGQAVDVTRGLCRIEDCKTVAVVGSRPPKPDAPLEAWDRWLGLERACIAFVNSLPAGTVVVSGAVPWIERGIDQAAERTAQERGLAVQSWRPQRDMSGYTVWVTDFTPSGQRHKWLAGPRHPTFAAAAFWRNGKMVEVADGVKAFHDGVSRGTADTIRKARAAGKLLP